jgi:hypothetical protein
MNRLAENIVIPIRRSAERDLATEMDALLLAGSLDCNCEVLRRLRGSG